MKKITVTIFSAMFALAGMAQCPVAFHAKASIGTSYFWGKHSSSETKLAYKASIGAEYALSRTWVLQSALEFVSIGGKDDIEYTGNASINELYLQIPVRMMARLFLNKNYHISLSAGPYIAYGIGGKTSGETYDPTSSHHSSGYRFKLDTFGSMLDNNMGNNRFDAGISLGLTFEYRRFLIGAEAQVGMVTVNKQLNQMINPSDNGNTYMPKNFASFFTIGYRFW